MPLLEALKEAGFIDVPEQALRPLPDFGHALQEARAAREATAVIIEHGLGTITISGEDRAKFLHNFCTNDIKKMQPGENCEAFFCNVKGRVLAVAIVICEEDRLVVLTDETRIEFLHAHLDRYLITEDVTLTMNDVQNNVFLLVGEKAPLDHMSPSMTNVTVTSWETGSRPAKWLIGATDSLVEVIRECVEEGALIAGHDAWEAIRIESAFPKYGTDISDENLAQEAHRTEQAISFVKGCYLGQEPIARLDAMGHVNRQLERYEFADSGSPPSMGGAVSNQAGEDVGTITSVCLFPGEQRGIVLAMVKTKAQQATQLTAFTSQGQTVSLIREAE